MAVPEIRDESLQLTGLTPEQVEESRTRYGENVLTPPARDPWWKLYLEKFEDPVIRILIIAAVITIVVGVVDGQYVEGIAIIIAILLATTLAFINEYRAKQEFDVLNQVNDEAPTNVLRSGAYSVVPRRDLVVGDMVLIEAGDELPADGWLHESIALQVNESLLTGESVPIHKTVNPNGGDDPLYADNKLFRSTMVVDGHGMFQVSAVGNATKIGEIAQAATGETDEVTPLNAQLERLSKLIGVVGFAVAGLTYAALVLHETVIGALVLTTQQWVFFLIVVAAVMTAMVRIWLPIVYDAFELVGRERTPPRWLETGGALGWGLTFGAGAAVFAVGVLVASAFGWIAGTPSQWLPGEAATELLRFFMIAVTIIVVAVPEGLPMSVTLSLAYSMRRMTATNNLVRRMHATETVGAATVICSDKTGTLTLNQMRVREAHFPALGSRPLTHDLDSEVERLIAEAFSANTTANLSRLPGEPIRPLGDSTEGALLMWLQDRGVDYVRYRGDFHADSQLTFSAERKYMGTLGSSTIGSHLVHLKGAPEIIMDQCTQVLTENGVEPLTEDLRLDIEDQLHSYQRRGMRTLAFSYKPVVETEDHPVEELAQDMIWLGYVAIADPIRPEVPTAIQACRDAGINVKVVTGDNAETAKEIARQIGLWDLEDDEIANAHLDGRMFAELEGEALYSAVRNLKVLSRARPMDKTRLVTTLQQMGEVVAVTGDGTNDAPALNFANVGLAMGSGTDIAKEASDIVLLDDSFRSIVNAVMWGRSLYQNIQRFILFQLTINVAALGIALLGPFIGVEFPLTVIQMLWVNLIMDTFASLALATEPARWDVMKQKPRQASDFIISPEMRRRIFSFGATFIVVLVGFLLVIQGDGVVTAHELTLFYATFIMLQFWNLFNARVLGLDMSAFKGIGENKSFVAIAAAILIGTILIVQFGGEIFRTTPLSILEWLLIIVLTSPVVLLGEFLRYSRDLRARNAAEAEQQR